MKKETIKANNDATPVADVANVAVNIEQPVKRFKTTKNEALFNKKWSERVPEHIRNLVYILRNNTEIRRYTALGIINYLMQKGEIAGEKRYVYFVWNKFRVQIDGIRREYLYTEPFFLNCFVAAFSSFSASAQRTINAFCKAEMSIGIDKAVDTDEVNNIIFANEQHQFHVETSIDNKDKA